MMLNGMLQLVDSDDDTFTGLAKDSVIVQRNVQLFAIMASICQGEALSIASGMTEGHGRDLYLRFDTLWRSTQPI